MIKFIYVIFCVAILFSCEKKVIASGKFRQDFSSKEQELLKEAKIIIEDTYFGTFITIDKNGQPKARVMEPFAPDENFVIWLATNPRSRKVTELKNNTTATVHYYNKTKFAYVSLYGNAFLVNDETIKAQKFKKGWEQFYKNKKDDYLLIKFIPNTLELISISNKYTGDSITWKPHLVVLR